MNIALDQIDPDAANVVRRLKDSGHAAYLVGGCVRDLLLGLKPKDFDVVTSATPPEIKKLFRNSRIIGRRFRLAHVFYGPKIIETSTFRANPREMEDDDNDGAAPESGDLLIRRDNVFGTPEQDARRRDFTVNGLFYDIQTKQVIDHVEGLPDLEARVVRTIGDPDIRFREDPIRILRAVKFAARCNLTIEPETYRRMMEHRQEIAKCAQARVSEEFYRLLRAGAAKRSLELLVETEMLELLVPELARGLKGEPADEEAALRRRRFWAYMAALDRSSSARPVAPSNALILAALLLPPLRDALDPDSNGVRDVGHMVAQAIAPALERLRPSRRDSELARQILLAIRHLLASKNPRRRKPPVRGEFAGEANRLADLVADAEAADPTLAGRPVLLPGTVLGEPTAAEEGEEASPEIVYVDDDRHRGRDRDRDRDRDRGRGQPYPARPAQLIPASPPMSLAALGAAARALMAPDLRPAFLGAGGFGGPWSRGEG
ncbi:MAG TPA: polynucleotide adenylyltransferase PcnB [Polyangia bacterium]|nr:polynucleotide adenylyltransferase PcnB [Polyangia bacterium]